MSVRKPKMTFMFMLLAVLNLFVACGSDEDDDNDRSAQEEQTPRDQDEQGSYEAVLNPLNISAGDSPKGAIKIRIRGDQVDMNVSLEGAHATLHPQYIYTGSSCPDALSDVNNDGFVDYQESKGRAGNILIPLDSNINTQAAGGAYRTGSRYNYNERASLTTMLSDLNAPDPVPADDIVKLNGERLNLAGRVVIIHGVRASTTLPATVSGAGSVTPQRSLPIACGILRRVADNEEPIPVPVPVPTPTPPTPPAPTPLCPVETSFSTRLDNELLISGVRCRGGETTEVVTDEGSRVFVCRTGQWLVTVDNVNRCNSDGGCTEAFVFPVVSELRRASESNPPTQCTFNMRPVSPISPSQLFEMQAHQVRFYNNREPQVIPR